MRSQLFKRKFTFSIEALVEKYNESGDIGEIAQKAINGPKNLQVHRIVASELWSFDSSSSNLCGCYLSPWNVLQCYLESILQVRSLSLTMSDLFLPNVLHFLGIFEFFYRHTISRLGVLMK